MHKTGKNIYITSSFIILACVILAITMSSIESLNVYYNKIIYKNIFVFFKENNVSLHFISNDILMSLFFFYIGIELKNGFLFGSLSDSKVRRTVIMASVGGIIIPSIIYLSITFNSKLSYYWGASIATDTVFSLSILWIFKEKVPIGLILFLSALSVLDDLFFNIVLVLFYTSNISIDYAFYCSISIALMFLMNFINIKYFSPYFFTGAILWFFLYKAGFHGMLSGIIVAFTIPCRYNLKLKKDLKYIRDTFHKKTIKKQNHKTECIDFKTIKKIEKIKKNIEPIVFLFILPLFSFVNSGFPISLNIIIESLQNKASISIFLALFIGKFIGINLFTIFSFKVKIGKLPQNINMEHILSVSILSGIGFTMSFFMTDIIVDSKVNSIFLKTGILFSSIFSGLLGFLYLNRRFKNQVPNLDN